MTPGAATIRSAGRFCHWLAPPPGPYWIGSGLRLRPGRACPTGGCGTAYRTRATSYRPRQTPPVLLHTGRPTLSRNALLALAGDQVRQFEITIQASQDEATV